MFSMFVESIIIITGVYLFLQLNDEEIDAEGKVDRGVNKSVKIYLVRKRCNS